MLQSLDRLTGRGRLPGTVQLHAGRLEQRLDGQGRFATPRHTGDGHELAQRVIDRDALQVVARRLDHGDFLLVALAALVRHRNGPPPRKIVARDAGRVCLQFGRHAMRHDRAAMHTGPRPDVIDVIGLADRFLVMLDHDDRIALIAQVLERRQKPVVVALVQTDAGFIEDIQDPRQTAADLRRQPDALTLATRQGSRVSGKCQVLQANVVQKPQPLANFLQDGARDLVVLFGQGFGHLGTPVQRLLDGHLHDLANMLHVDLHRQRLGPKTIATTGAARPVVLIALELLAHPCRIRLAVATFHVRDHALEHPAHLIDAPALVIAELDLLVAGSAQKHLLDLLRQILPRQLLVEPVMLRDRLDRLDEIRRLPLVPGRNRPFRQRQRHVRHHQPVIKKQLHPQSVAFRTGPERRIEGKQARLDLGDGEARHRAGEFFGEGDPLRLAILGRSLQNGDAIGQIQRRAERIRQPRLQPFAHDDPVDHNVDVMPELLVQFGRLIQIVEFPVDLDPLEALLAQLQHLLPILALPVAHDGGQQISARPLLHRHDAVHHILHLLRSDRQTCGRRIRGACAREQQTHVVIDFRDRADS